MHFDLQHNFQGVATELKRVARNFPSLIAKGVVDATNILFQEDRTQLSELVYDRDETKVRRRNRKSGRIRVVKLWRRTSQLLRNERFYFRGAGSETEGTIDNRTPYAAARHEQKYPAKTQFRTLAGSGKKARSEWRDRPNRSAPWRDISLANKGDQAADAFWRAIAAAKSAQ